MSEQVRSFNQIVEEDFEKLELYTTAITRAHGESHPEAFQVREIFQAIGAKVKEAGADKPNLDEEFTQLRQVTDNYAIPGDVCETYEGTYNMLSELDKSYHA